MLRGAGSSGEVLARNVLNSDKWFNEEERVEWFIDCKEKVCFSQTPG